MKRRKFIALTTTGIIALGASSVLIHSILEKDPSDELLKELPYILTLPELISLGQSYLKQFPHENTVKILNSLLRYQDFETTIQKEYKTDNIVVLDGWVFSKTEGRQCTLLSLTYNSI